MNNSGSNHNFRIWKTKPMVINVKNAQTASCRAKIESGQGVKEFDQVASPQKNDFLSQICERRDCKDNV